MDGKIGQQSENVELSKPQIIVRKGYPDFDLNLKMTDF